jgi:Asp-tRNA(Asn)/Glu-tRNA(Gln) amidotransferase A subunit family amidase
VRAGEELAKRSRVDAMERAATRTEQGSAGLPVGVQVVARPWREHVALAAMRAIEEAVGLFPRPPEQ